MNTQLAVVEKEQSVLTAQDIKSQVNLIQQVMDAVMKDGHHYGTIPGCGPKPTLLKAGAEKLMLTFKLAPDTEVADLSTPDCIRYRCKVTLTNYTTGYVMGSGVGECSSDEEKYKWRKAFPEEYEEAQENRRRIKYGKGNQPGMIIKTKQVRTEPADVANTVLKMSKKRALVDACLTTLGASDIFSQDLEDMESPNPETLHQKPAEKPRNVPDPGPIQDESPFSPEELDQMDRMEIPTALPKCPVCKKEANLIPAGVTRQGKEYTAFYGCPSKCVLPNGKKWAINQTEWESGKVRQ